MYPVATLLLKRSLFCALAACCSLSVRAQQIGPEAEQAVGYVLNADNAKLTRAGTLLPLQAKAGDFLFAGDALRSLTGSLSFLYCPERSSYELPAVGEVTFVQEHLDLQEGQLVNHTSQAICRLPRITRNQPGTQLHNAASLIKDVLPDQPLEGSLDSRLLDLPVDRRDALRQELGPIDGRLRENPGDIIVRLARAALLDEYGLSADAANEYRKVLESAPDSTGARSRAMLHDENHQKKRLQAVRQQAVSNEERTYALLVGVSSYQDPRIRPLQYAHEDALLFERHLRSARGGQLGDQDLTVLLDEKATAARIRLALDTLLKAQADQNDTVLIFVASHGTVDPRTGQGFIVAYDSDPEDLAATALPMQDLQNLVNLELRDVGRVHVYVDVCHAGKIGTIENKGNRINAKFEDLARAEGDLFGFRASGSREPSYEGPQFGGGHGAFSYFLLDALNGAADELQDDKITIAEIVRFVRNRVEEATANKQHPTEFGDFEYGLQLVDLTRPGIEVSPPREIALQAQVSRPERQTEIPTSTRGLRGGASEADVGQNLEKFQAAVDSGRILPTDSDDAFEALAALRRPGQLDGPAYLTRANQLRAALEERGQQVVLRYLKGEQVPQVKADFIAGASYYSAAQLLTTESLLLAARSEFCLGRAEIFDKDYSQAIELLERAARLDPTGAYSYNALGIAYLEQADFENATLAFRDAIRLAPRWAYPRHNLALTYTEVGDYRSAEQTYRDAILQTPEAAYLQYNLGLLLYRLNRKKEAEVALLAALDLQPQLAEAHTALGILYASLGRRAAAEQAHRQALRLKPELLEARHNLGLLFATPEKRGRRASAEQLKLAVELWKENVARNPSFIASRLRLAGAYYDLKEVPLARQEYQAVLQLQPDYVAARVAFSDVLLESGDRERATAELEAALDHQASDPQIAEKLADLYLLQGREKDALRLYESALKNTSERQERKRLERKTREIRDP